MDRSAAINGGHDLTPASQKLPPDLSPPPGVPSTQTQLVMLFADLSGKLLRTLHRPIIFPKSPHGWPWPLDRYLPAHVASVAHVTAGPVGKLDPPSRQRTRRIEVLRHNSDLLSPAPAHRRRNRRRLILKVQRLHRLRISDYPQRTIPRVIPRTARACVFHHQSHACQILPHALHATQSRCQPLNLLLSVESAVLRSQVRLRNEHRLTARHTHRPLVVDQSAHVSVATREMPVHPPRRNHGQAWIRTLRELHSRVRITEHFKKRPTVRRQAVPNMPTPTRIPAASIAVVNRTRSWLTSELRHTPHLPSLSAHPLVSLHHSDSHKLFDITATPWVNPSDSLSSLPAASPTYSVPETDHAPSPIS